MVYNNYIFNLLFIFIITILIGYIFGITIVSLIDNRLNKFNIKDVKSYESFDNIEDFKTKNSNRNSEINREITVSRTYNFQTGEEIKRKKNNIKNKILKDIIMNFIKNGMLKRKKHKYVIKIIITQKMEVAQNAIMVLQIILIQLICLQLIIKFLI